jgi:hypothetical protein
MIAKARKNGFLDYKSAALPTELCRRKKHAELSAPFSMKQARTWRKNNARAI